MKKKIKNKIIIVIIVIIDVITASHACPRILLLIKKAALALLDPASCLVLP
jgi:hypothetical protein